MNENRRYPKKVSIPQIRTSLISVLQETDANSLVLKHLNDLSSKKRKNERLITQIC